jgi:hypothetical protein
MRPLALLCSVLLVTTLQAFSKTILAKFLMIPGLTTDHEMGICLVSVTARDSVTGVVLQPRQPERIKEIVGGGLRRTSHRHKSKAAEPLCVS